MLVERWQHTAQTVTKCFPVVHDSAAKLLFLWSSRGFLMGISNFGCRHNLCSSDFHHAFFISLRDALNSLFLPVIVSIRVCLLIYWWSLRDVADGWVTQRAAGVQWLLQNKTFVFRCWKTGCEDNCAADFSNVNKMFLHFCQPLTVTEFFIRRRIVWTRTSITSDPTCICKYPPQGGANMPSFWAQPHT